MHKLITLLLGLSLLAVSSAFADEYSITVTKVNPATKNSSYDFTPSLQGDGAIYSISSSGDKDQVISKQLLNGKLVVIGKIPHPDIVRMNSNNPIHLAANSTGTLVVTYPYKNGDQIVNVFYSYANNTWTRLADYKGDKGLEYISDVFIDNDAQVMIRIKDQFTMFNLYNGIWFYLDNYINKSTLKKEPVIAESGDYVYVSTVNKKLDNFEGYRVGSKSVVSSKVTVPMSAGFALSCTTLQNESSMVISFINSHDNLTKHIIRFRRMDFTNEIFTQKEATITDMLTPDFVKQSTELTDSFVKLGTTFVSLFNSSGSKDLVPIPTIGEVDLAPYLKSYISDPIRSVQCATVGKDSYFVLQPSVTTSGQYVYIKISQKESGINLKQESNVSLPQ